jgi:heat shock protein HslJ
MKVISLRILLPGLLLPTLFCFAQALAQVPASLTNSPWGLISIKDKHGQTLRPTGKKDRYRISFDLEGRVEAHFDCNVGSGTSKSESPGQVTLGPMALTKMVCPRGPLYDRIVNDVQLFRAYRLEGGHLFLATADSTYEFEALPSVTLEADRPPSIYGLVWRLSSANGVDVGATQAYLEFDEKSRRFSGDGGCNRISGDLMDEGLKISFERAISTKRACVDTRLQKTENSFFGSLAEISEYEIDTGGFLELKKDGRTILVLTSEQLHAEGHVKGTIRYLQRLALPRTALIEVKLLEVAPAGSVLPDDNARGVDEGVIKEKVIEADGRQVPIKFDLTYDPYSIDPKMRYVIRVRVFDRNRLLFNTTDWYPVITFGNPDSVDVIVKPLPR